MDTDNTFEIFWSSGSCPSWTILLALELKRVPYASRLLQLSKKENKTSEYLAMNPRGKTPTVRDGDYVVYESIAILAYLERKHPEPPLLGATAEETATVMRLISEFRSYVEPEFDRLVLPFWKNTVKEQASEMTAAAANIRAELATYATLLTRHDYLAGPRITAADLVLYPGLMQLLRALEKPEAIELDLGIAPLPERSAAISRWKARIESLPNYEKTYPPHWRS